ncbi:hypothetical protein HDZ31DRAFT_80514 [Schizophyllum fasciatum]
MSDDSHTANSAPALPTTQRAWIIERRGPPEKALRLHHDWPVPKPQPGEVLVRVQAAALNPVGYKLMALLPNFAARRPLPAEYDFAGTIADANGAAGYKVGDPVFGFVEVSQSFKTRQGALAEYVRVPATAIAPRPANVPATGAAGITLAGETAYQSLFRADALALSPLGRLEPGQSVFVNGGSSSVGAFAIQLAKAKGAARVVASASGANEAYVRALGADASVDYTRGPVHAQLARGAGQEGQLAGSGTKFHLIVDAVGLTDPALYTHSAAYLAPGGVYVSTGYHPRSLTTKEFSLALKHAVSTVWPRALGGTPRRHWLVMLHHKEEDLKDIAGLLAEGSVKPVVDSVFAFEDALKAYERILTNRAKGKVVVKVDPDVE